VHRWRWDRYTGRLIAGIVDTAILDVEDLDELASCFLWSDRFRFEYPVSWIGTKWLEIDLEGGKGAIGPSVVHLDPTTPVPTERSIRPPLRRWAASRVLCADPGTFDAIRARAKGLGPLDGGAVVSGILDAIEVLDQHVGRRAIHLGLGWPRGSVRLLALVRLAAIDPGDARRRAAADPDLKVRTWTPGQAPVASVVPGKESAGQDTRRGRRAPRSGQAELFPEEGPPRDSAALSTQAARCTQRRPAAATRPRIPR
jgi:hypothetical protein